MLNGLADVFFGLPIELNRVSHLPEMYLSECFFYKRMMSFPSSEITGSGAGRLNDETEVEKDLRSGWIVCNLT